MSAHGATFPYLLVRLPAVPRSRLKALAYRRTLACRKQCSANSALLKQAFLEDSAESDPEAVRLLQWDPFLSALFQANPELARRVSCLRRLPGCCLRKKERQTARAALRYLWRAALRPVPQGWLCGTALGRLGEPAADPPAALDRREAVSTLAASYLAAVARSAWRVPAAARRSRLYLSPLCWTGADGRVWFWQQDEEPRPVPDQFVGLVEALRHNPGVPLAALAGLLPGPAIAEALECGLVEQYASGPSEDQADALPRVLWEAAFEDVSLLTHIAALSPAGKKVGKPSPVKTDSYVAAVLVLTGVPGLEAFLREMGTYASRIADWMPPACAIAGAVLRYLVPSGSRIRLPEFYAGCRRLARDHGVEFRAPDDWTALASALGIDTGTVREALDLSSIPTAAGSIEFPVPGGWASGPAARRRICARFRRATDGPCGPRFQLSHFGGDRMSLLPRYAEVPFESQPEFRREVQAWMSHWPEVSELYGTTVHDADRHAPATPRVIHLPGTPPPVNSIPIADIRVAARPGDGIPVLTDSTGQPVRPAFFGMAAEWELPPLAQFALSLGLGPMTVMEVICSDLSRMLARALAKLSGSVIAIPEITLGQTIVLSPQIWIVPGSALPVIASPAAARDFALFHDWLDEHKMPAGLVQAVRPGAEPQWLDFRHPEGVTNFLRLFHSNPALFLCGSFLEHDDQGLPCGSEWYEPEYYAELDAGRIGEPMPAVAGWAC